MFADENLAARSQIQGVSPDAWFDRLQAEHDQLQTELRRLRETDPRRGLELAGVLWAYWVARGRLVEGRGWLDAWWITRRWPRKSVAAEARESDLDAASVAEEGHSGQICLSGDLARRSYLEASGGSPGYRYLLEGFLPHLERAGLDDELVRSLAVDNPARFLAWR